MINTVNNSNLPTTMNKLRIHFTTSGKWAKLFTGPTVPMPGPMFPMHVAVAPAAVIKSTPSNANIIDPTTNSKI